MQSLPPLSISDILNTGESLSQRKNYCRVKENKPLLLNTLRSLLPENNESPVLNRVYKINRDIRGNFKLNLDSDVRKIKRVIYQFFRVIGEGQDKGEFTIENGIVRTLKGRVKVLDGKTEMTVSRRISGYIYALNHSEKERGQTEFSQDLRNCYEEFYFRIRKIVAEDEDINEAETSCIIEDDAVETGYNKNYGGGGSNKLNMSTLESPSILIEPITPEKTYPVVVDVKGRKHVATSPGVESKENVIYFFRHIIELKEYVGYTTTTVQERKRKHESTFNNPHKESGQRLLPKAVNQSPTKFVFGVYGQFKDGEDPRPHEGNCQKKKRTAAPNGYTVARPGGGGVRQNYGRPTQAST